MSKEKHEKNLKKVKQFYEEISHKNNLLDFKFVNENFEIENIDIEETDLFIKQIRKHITEKIFYMLRTIEAFINPSNAPMFVMGIVKDFSESERELIQELYKKLAKYEIEAFGLEAKYDEKKEIEFIRKIGQEWKEISEDLIRMYSAMKSNHDKDSKKSTKSYLG